MAVFHAFRALRPTPEKAADVAALPYDVVNREEAKSIGDENPLSFLHIDRPEMDLEPETDLYDDRVYEKAKENIKNLNPNATIHCVSAKSGEGMDEFVDWLKETITN